MKTYEVLPLAILASLQIFCHAKELGSRASPHIINGEEVKPHSIPYQVALTKQPTGFFCGGSLISDQWVLTAAHCAEVTKDITVIIGAHNLSKADEGLDILVEKIVIHPKWFSWFGNTGDIALLKLKRSVELGNKIKPVRLPRLADKNTLFLDSGATMSGWGQVSFWRSSRSEVLRATTERVMSMFRCKAAFLFLLVSDSHICTTGWNSRSACFGDSGGPLVITESDGEQTLVGITSFGSRLCRIWPAVFTRVTSYLDWIHAETGIAPRL